MSFLEMLDVLNQELIAKGEEPVAFDSDCREGICGMCGFVVNGYPHGPQPLTTVCQLHMRHFHDGETLRLEPFRAKAFPVIKDLAIDRSALDRIVMAGGYISINAGGPRDANSILVGKKESDLSMDAASCIGCGACVAACPNASASLFTGGKISHLGLLPQGELERKTRALNMVERHSRRGLRRLHGHRRLRRGLPEGTEARLHRPHEQGLPRRDPDVPRGGRGRRRGLDPDASLL